MCGVKNREIAFRRKLAFSRILTFKRELIFSREIIFSQEEIFSREIIFSQVVIFSREVTLVTLSASLQTIHVQHLSVRKSYSHVLLKPPGPLS